MNGLSSGYFMVFIGFIFVIILTEVGSIQDAKRLYSYMKESAEELQYFRPVTNINNSIVIYIGITFIQIMNVDEKSQIITSSVELRLIWMNKLLRWDPNEYGGIKSIYLPSNSMWQPDVVLFNNIDGMYKSQFSNPSVLHYSGLIDWRSPAIFKSGCTFEMKYFPYDEQRCFLDFGSWTYNKAQLKLRHILQLKSLLLRNQYSKGSLSYKVLTNKSSQSTYNNGMFFQRYQKNGEWDLLDSPTYKMNSDITHGKYDIIKFGMHIRRKIMFYNINLIFPMVAMSILAALVFYLPADSYEKITLSTLVVLAITVFFVLLSEQVPNTSLVVPIINQYLIITFLLICASLAITCLVLNFDSRSDLTHPVVSESIKTVFLKILPKLLLIEVPESESDDFLHNEFKKLQNKSKTATAAEFEVRHTKCQVDVVKNRKIKCYGELKNLRQIIRKKKSEIEALMTSRESIAESISVSSFAQQLSETTQIVSEIASDFLDEIASTKIKDQWKFVAHVLDRLILYIFCITCIAVGMITYLQSPILYDPNLPLNTAFYNDSSFNELFFKYLLK